MQNRVASTFSLMLLIGLLFWGSPALAYYPPLQQGDHTVYPDRIQVRVWDPVAVSFQEGDYYYSGEVVLSLFNQGMMFAAIRQGTAYQALLATYDPARGWRFHVPDEATDSAVVEKIADGVITYQVMTNGAGDVHYRLYTYEPTTGQWKMDSHSFSAHPNFVLSQNGVVALSANDLVYFSLYNPVSGAWVGRSVSTSYYPLCLKILSDGSVQWYEFYDGSNCQAGHFYGFREGAWVESQYTNPLAFFVAQPAFGKAPLAVYFTDMSLGASAWSYAFGDGTAPTGVRSPWHTFNQGNFICRLTINPGTPEQDIYEAAITAQSGSLSFLPLLLD